MRRIERLQAITEALRRAAPRTVSAGVLAEKLDVSRRTIERDLATLSMAGLPIYSQTGRKGGTAIVGNATRSLVSLSTGEIVSLIVAARLNRGAPYATAADSAIGKLVDALSPPQQIAVDELRRRFRVATDPPELRPRVRSVIEDAVSGQTVVRITYGDADGETTRRSVEPVGLYRTPDQWSLAAWCRLREAPRLFHLHRIERADPTSEPCLPRDLDEVLGWVPLSGHMP